MDSAVFLIGCIALKLLLSGWLQILASAIRPVMFFYVGMLYFIYRNRIGMEWRLCVVALVGTIVSMTFAGLQYAVFLFLPYLLAYVGFTVKTKLSDFARHGEISYGMYLFGWPIQQTLCSLFEGRMPPYVNFMLAMPASVFFGFVICKGVEEPLRRWEKRCE